MLTEYISTVNVCIHYQAHSLVHVINKSLLCIKIFLKNKKREKKNLFLQTHDKNHTVKTI